MGGLAWGLRGVSPATLTPSVPRHPQLSQGIATLCAAPRDAWRDPEGCCSRDGPERRRCFDTTYLARVTLGAAVAPLPPGQDE